ncbi:MAG TPA: hypothetical protein DCQ30_11670 [Acidimicrobiaceae bacterium]|nr:hypothetical protein [Acidimicrobiaceae bacterium]
MGGTVMGATTDTGGPKALDLVQQSLNRLVQKRRTEGLKPVEEIRYRNLRALQDTLLGREAS